MLVYSIMYATCLEAIHPYSNVKLRSCLFSLQFQYPGSFGPYLLRQLSIAA